MADRFRENCEVVAEPEPACFQFWTLEAMEDALAKNFSSDAIKDIKVPADGLNSDIHGSAEYRAHLVGVMARRAVARANEFSAGDGDEAAAPGVTFGP